MISPEPAATASSTTLHFLNVMRFLSAMWVIIFHMWVEQLNALVAGGGQDPQWVTMLERALLLPFNGVAAVMVFFVISGFCIHHLPGRPLETSSFLLQRLIRIGLPLAVAYGVHLVCDTTEDFRNIAWSIYCEIVYYLMYPALRLLMQCFGTGRVLAISTVISWLFCLLPEDGYGHIHSYGIGGTWLVCLPAWLCGCLLAEWRAGVSRPPALVQRLNEAMTSSRGLWLARLSVWALSSLLLLLGKKEIVPFKYSMPAFAFVILVWLMAELARPWPENWLAKAGVMGYSLYLVHPVQSILPSGTETGLYMLAMLMIKFVVALGASLAFYFVIEKPSHRLARSFAKRPVIVSAPAPSPG